MKTLQDLFENQLKDLFSAETQAIDALLKMIEKTDDERLKKAFEDHLENTKEQKSRIENICRKLNITPSGITCRAMEGLIREFGNFTNEAETKEVMDAGLVAQAHRIEHYKISGYGTAIRFAKVLGHHGIIETLQKTLDEEYAVNNALNKLAQDRLNRKAIENG